MYLSDNEIHNCLKDLDISVSGEGGVFLPDEQIQPCSIDLRLSDIFWIPKEDFKVDLRYVRGLAVFPEEHYTEYKINHNNPIALDPGKLLHARTYEEFTVPPNCAGQIIAKSSIARKGLMIHCVNGFINPGWRGHMPLQLVNLSQNSFEIFPYVFVCQLCLIKLTSIPTRKYGSPSNIYMNDEGTPFAT